MRSATEDAFSPRAGPFTGVILAGGPSSRFGGLPKGLQVVGDERIIDRVAGALRRVTDRLLLISNDPAATDWLPEARVAGDVLAGQASLIGIHAAISRAGTNAIVVAWDMPFVPVALLRELRRRLRPDIDAVIPIGPKGPELACAAYSPSALAHVERSAASGAMKLSGLVDVLPRVDTIPLSEVSRFGDPTIMFFNANTPDDLARAQAIAAAL